MRIFIAINPDPIAAEHLQAAVAPLRGEPALASIHWTPIERWHLTLAFIGEVEQERLPPLVRRLREGLAALAAPEPVRCQSAGAFGDRLVWVGLRRADGREAEPLQRHARAVRRLARQVRMPVDGKPWLAHLTIGRDRPGGTADQAAARLADYEGPAWQPTKVLVMSSILGPSPRHEVQATIDLG